MANIPLIGEGFRKRTTFSADPAGYTSWHGPNPRLNVADGSVAYGHVDAVASDLYGAAVVGYLPAFVLAETSTVQAQVRFPGGLAGNVFVGFSLGNNPTTIGTNRGNQIAVPAGGDWHLLTYEITLIQPLFDNYRLAAAAGNLFVFASHAPRAYDVSYLGFSQVVAGRPLRWRQRNDQFASGAPPAARGVRTVQGNPLRGRGIV